MNYHLIESVMIKSQQGVASDMMMMSTTDVLTAAPGGGAGAVILGKTLVRGSSVMSVTPNKWGRRLIPKGRNATKGSMEYWSTSAFGSGRAFTT